ARVPARDGARGGGCAARPARVPAGASRARPRARRRGRRTVDGALRGVAPRGGLAAVVTATTRRHPLRAALAALVLALAGALVPAPSAAAAEADTLHALLNEARWSQGLAGLLRNGAMDAVAADWAAQLAASGTLSHNPNYSAQIPGGWV